MQKFRTLKYFHISYISMQLLCMHVIDIIWPQYDTNHNNTHSNNFRLLLVDRVITSVRYKIKCKSFLYRTLYPSFTDGNLSSWVVSVSVIGTGDLKERLFSITLPLDKILQNTFFEYLNKSCEQSFCLDVL